MARDLGKTDTQTKGGYCMWEKLVILAVLAGVLWYWYRVERPKDLRRKKEQHMKRMLFMNNLLCITW